jgi:butyrate kinase
VAENSDKWWDLVNMLMNIQVSKNMGNLTSLASQGHCCMVLYSGGIEGVSLTVLAVSEVIEIIVSFLIYYSSSTITNMNHWTAVSKFTSKMKST